MGAAPRDTDRDWIRLGRLVRPHSLKGEVCLLPDNPASTALRVGETVAVRRSGEQRLWEIVGLRRHKGFFLLHFAGVTDRNAAEALVGGEVWVRAQKLPILGEGEYYHHELLGMAVVTIGGDVVGEVVEIWPAPGGDVLVVRRGEREHLIPMVEVFVKRVDRLRREIAIETIPGLLNE